MWKTGVSSHVQHWHRLKMAAKEIVLEKSCFPLAHDVHDLREKLWTTSIPFLSGGSKGQFEKVHHLTSTSAILHHSLLFLGDTGIHSLVKLQIAIQKFTCFLIHLCKSHPKNWVAFFQLRLLWVYPYNPSIFQVETPLSSSTGRSLITSKVPMIVREAKMMIFECISPAKAYSTLPTTEPAWPNGGGGFRTVWLEVILELWGQKCLKTKEWVKNTSNETWIAGIESLKMMFHVACFEVYLTRVKIYEHQQHQQVHASHRGHE